MKHGVTETLVVLDLEGTTINSWEEPYIINTVKIRPAVKGQRIGVLSLSMQTEEDKDDFRKRIKPQVELTFGVEVIEIIGSNDIISILKEKHGLIINDSLQLSQIYGKELLFLLYAKSMPVEGVKNYVLFDDSVSNSKHIYGKHLTVTLIKV